LAASIDGGGDRSGVATFDWDTTQMNSKQTGSPSRCQRGVSMFGLLIWGITVGFIGYLLVRTLPTVNEFMTIQKSVDQIAAAPPPTVGDIRAAFDRQKSIEYAIKSISGKDLEITKENERVVIAFAYDVEVPIMGPAYLLLKYEGRSK
jgi:Domain of unknown function (DUF4845)